MTLEKINYKSILIISISFHFVAAIFSTGFHHFDEHFQILGPSPAPIEKIRGLWRFHIIIKSINKKNDTISKFIFENIGFSIFEKKINGIQIILDVDPISMM